jgi:hypothetical protein
MIKNICKMKQCLNFDSDFPNNCSVIKEIRSCRLIEIDSPSLTQELQRRVKLRMRFIKS